MSISKSDKSMEEGKFGYIVYAGIDVRKEPCAVFSKKEDAEKLSQILQSPFPPKEIEYKDESEFATDKYLPELEEGKWPFFVNMFADGGILREIDDHEPFIVADPSLVDGNEGKAIGIGGTFWAHGLSEAEELADQFRLQLIHEGKLNI